MAYIQTAIKPGILPMPSNIKIGIKYTKLGIVCIISRTGSIDFSTLSDLAIRTPIGIPTAIHIIVQTVMIATVAMQSFHIPKYPIKAKAITLPTTSFQLLEPNQAKAPSTINIIGQGVANNNFSNLIRAIVTLAEQRLEKLL